LYQTQARFRLAASALIGVALAVRGDVSDGARHFFPEYRMVHATISMTVNRTLRDRGTAYEKIQLIRKRRHEPLWHVTAKRSSTENDENWKASM